jgi:hypothetical protein
MELAAGGVKRAHVGRIVSLVIAYMPHRAGSAPFSEKRTSNPIRANEPINARNISKVSKTTLCSDI